MKDVVVVNGVRYYSPAKVAEKLGVSKRSVERYISSGRLQCGYPTARRMVSETMLRAFLETPRPEDKNGDT